MIKFGIRLLTPIMVFVSFSMPRQSLIAYMQDARKIHASIIVRGFINNSFKETVNTISLLVKEAGGGGIEINPFAFTTFHITKVPSVVVIPNNSPCVQQSSCRIDKDYDVIAGNITLQAALVVVGHHGQAAVTEANNALTLLRGGKHV
jgi:conjugal transfer pilus assembly protein TrbC